MCLDRVHDAGGAGELRRFNYGYVILGAGFMVLCFSSGARMAFGLVLKPMSDDLGLSRSALTAAFTLFMVVTLFNSMPRIDPALLEPAVDAGASRWQVITQVVIPLSRTGIALGSIFVLTLVMGDFFVVKIMSGGQSSSAVYAMWNHIAMLQYPSAAASAVVLLIVVVLMVAAILRVVDVRKELSG